MHHFIMDLCTVACVGRDWMAVESGLLSSRTRCSLAAELRRAATSRRRFRRSTEVETRMAMNAGEYRQYVREHVLSDIPLLDYVTDKACEHLRLTGRNRVRTKRHDLEGLIDYTVCRH